MLYSTMSANAGTRSADDRKGSDMISHRKGFCRSKAGSDTVGFGKVDMGDLLHFLSILCLC